MSNLDFWKSVEQTDPSKTKNAKVSGQHRTAVDAQYKKKCITEKFGIYGDGWGIEPDSEKYLRTQLGDTHLLHYTAVAFWKLGEKTGRFPIAASVKEAYVTSGGKGYLKVDDEAIKKVRTDALTKGFTDLGFNADIHMGLFEDAYYLQGAEAAAEIKRQDEAEEAINKAMAEIKDWCVKQTESASSIKNDGQYEKAMDRIASNVTVRCNAAAINSQPFVNRINTLKQERLNGSK